VSTSSSLDGTNLTAQYQARTSNYIAMRACKVKKVTIVFYCNSSYLAGDINLEWQLVKWTPQDDTTNNAAMTAMTITDHDAGYTEFDVHTLTFDVTDNAASTLAEKDCIAMCVRTTSGSSNGAIVRVLTYGQMNYEIELS